MPATPTATITSSSGRTFAPVVDAAPDVLAKTQYVTAGNTVKIAVAGADERAVIQAFDFSGPHAVAIGFTKHPTDAIPWTVPPTLGTREIGIKIKMPGQPDPVATRYKVLVKPWNPPAPKPPVVVTEPTTTPPPIVVVEPTPPAPPETTEPPPVVVPPVVTPAPYKFGICVTSLPKWDVPVTSRLWAGTKKIASLLSVIGCDGARLWWTFHGDPSDFKDHEPKWDRHRDWKRAGVGRFIFALAAGDWSDFKVPTPEASRASAIAIRDAVPHDLESSCDFEIGNEEFDDKYWPGTLAQFVTNFYNPVCEVMQAAGHRVILGGLNGGDPAGDYQKLIALGLKEPDRIGSHPYAENPVAYARKTLALAAFGLPIIETESNTKDGPAYKASDKGDKATGKVLANQLAVDVIRRKTSAVTEIYEFSLEYQEKTMTGPLGWFKLTRDADNVVTSAETTPLFEARFAAAVKAAVA